jgi:signal transduction histidine kinase
LQASRKDIAGALANLIENAMHAAKRAATWKWRPPETAVVFASACGIAAAALQRNIARLFDPFFTTRQDGTGWSGHSQERSRGARRRARVSSLPGRGTTFELLLPCRPS